MRIDAYYRHRRLDPTYLLHTSRLLAEGKELYIIAGGEGSLKAIASGKVTVPQYTWKVVVVLDEGAQVTADTRVIAVRTGLGSLGDRCLSSKIASNT